MKRDPLSVALSKVHSLSKGQQLVVRYILSDSSNVVFMSSIDVAQKIGVSDATVVRSCQALGYEGFADFKHALIGYLQEEKESPAERLLKNVERSDGSNDYSVLYKQDLYNLEETIRGVDIRVMENVVECLASSRKIFVLGLNSCAALAQFLFFHIRRMGGETELMTSGGGTMLEQMALAKSGDVLLVISFPRYSTDSIMALRVGRETGMTIVSLTNNLENQIAKSSDFALSANSDNPVSFMNSFVGPMCVCNLLVLRYGFRVKDQALASLTKLEKVRLDHNLYIEKTEYNSL